MVRVLKYNEAKLKITQLIQQNQLQPGDKLASERELADQLGMSIISVRRALAEFQEAGIVRKVSGIGSFYNGNLALDRCSSKIALVNIGDSLYPDSRSLCLMEEALQRFQASQKVFHVRREVQPEVLKQLQEYDKIAVTGFLNASWFECLSSLGKPMLQIGECDLPNSLSKLKPDWADALRVVLARFPEIDRKHCAFFLPELSSSTYGQMLRETLFACVAAERKELNEALVVHVPLATAIGTIDDFLRLHAGEIRLLVIENGSLLPFLLAPARSSLPSEIPIVVMYELPNLPRDIGRLKNFYPLTFVENILVRMVDLFFTMPCSFFLETHVDYVKAKLYEPGNAD